MLRFAVLALAAMAAVAFVGPATRAAPTPRVALRAGRPEGPEAPSPGPLRLGGAVLSMLAALALAVVPMEAQAAKSGGRIGGTASAARSKAPPRKAPAAVNKETTVINQTTVIAPPPVVAPVAPMGFAPAPVVVAAPPTVGDVIVGTVVGSAINNAITGGHHGPTSTDRMLENQQRQDERQLDQQKAEIDLLKSEIQSLKSK